MPAENAQNFVNRPANRHIVATLRVKLKLQNGFFFTVSSTIVDNNFQAARVFPLVVGARPHVLK
jgi:hypothetical protein